MDGFDDVDWRRLVDLARSAARKVAADFGIVEADDVQQEMLEYVVRYWDTLNPQVKTSDALLRKIFLRAGQKYALKERAYRDLVDGAYVYTTDEVRRVLREMGRRFGDYGDIMGRHDNLSGCDVMDNVHTAYIEASRGCGRLTKGIGT